MASRDRPARARSTSRDPRSAERARRAPRRDRSSRVSPVSVTETGEQEIHESDLLDPDVLDSDLDDGTFVGSDETEAADSDGDDTDKPRARRRHEAASSRSGGGLFAGVVARMAGMDAKRAVGLAIVVTVVALTLAMPLRTYFAQNAEFRQLTSSNEQLRRDVADYQQKVNEQNDPVYIEAQARQRLGFVRPGETPVVMMYPGDEARKEAQRLASEHARNAWYLNLLDPVATPPSGN